MDQFELNKFATAHWLDIAFGAMLLLAGIGGVAFHSLTNQLMRNDPSAWETLGRPKLFSRKSTNDELTWFWYILARKYRNCEIREIRVLGDLNFACFVAMWILFLAVITFGDLNRYNLRWNF